jgi:hypothetical protein
MRVTSTNVAALSTTFPLQGQQYEFLKWPARVQFAIVASAAGIVATVYSGSDLLQQRGPAVVKTTPTVYPDDFFLDDVADAGERLSVELNETANIATTDIETTVIITPLG